MKTFDFRRCGTVIQAGGAFRRIRWEDDTVEGTTLPAFRSLKKGDRFECVVTVPSWPHQGFRMLAARDVVVNTRPPVTPEQRKALWDRIMARDQSAAETVSWDELE